jgi:tRNA pseudouridine55 synthase
MLLCESFIRSNATLPHRMSIIDSIKPLLCESKFFLPPNTNNHTRADAKKMMKRKGGLKVGQGGTLDPLADGVLVLGIGRGTKHLGQFLECTKVSSQDKDVGHCGTDLQWDGVG